MNSPHEGNVVTARGRTRPLALSLVLVGIVARLLPHPINMTPVGASSLFSGARLRHWQAFLVPLVTMALTDPILGRIYGFPAFTWVTPVVYGSFLINVWLGRSLSRSNSPWRIGGFALLGSVQFFLLTNAGVWQVGSGGLYPHTAAGLMTCYLAGLPYFARTLLGDLVFSGLLFGIHGWLTRRAFPTEMVAKP